MSQKIDPREVLTYLNELGYTNINAQQLKEFIKDLKKLIKYENKHRKSYNIEKENIYPTTSTYSTTNYKDYYCDNHNCPHIQRKNVDETKANENTIKTYINHSLYNQPTVASKAKEVPRQERQISVHIVKPKSKAPNHEHCIHTTEHTIKPVTENESQLQFVSNIAVTSDGSMVDIETESTIRSIRPCSKQTVKSHGSSSKAARPKSSFMRPTYSKPVNKCDPVALYHYYQNEWKKQKFPGQETHYDLRWAVREKLLSSRKGDTVSRPSSYRKSSNSWKS